MLAHIVTTYLQEAVDALEEWCRRCFITVNRDKSSALFITERRQGPGVHVSMFSQIIPWRDKTKYVGVFIHKTLIKKKPLPYGKIIRPTISYTSVSWSIPKPRHG